MIELPKRVAENIGQFSGRAWLLPKLLDWWDHKDRRILLLTGGPGNGKSMILAWLAGFGPEPSDQVAAERLKQLRNAVKAAHFCQADSRNITPHAFAENVANQLAKKIEKFREALVATLADRVQVTAIQNVNTVTGAATNVAIDRIDLGALGDELSFDRAFTEPLRKLYTSGHSEPMLLLVDALDEALVYSADKTLPSLLSTLADFPAQVRIIATTRDDRRVLKLFARSESIDLIKNADPKIDDVENYAAGRLVAFNTVAAPKRKEFAERLAKQADGVFLYAAMVLDELLRHPSDDLPDLTTYPLPEGLSGFYHQFLLRELGKDERLWFDLYEPLLGLIAVAQGEGLTSQELAAIINKDIRPALRACEQYLEGELPDGPFRPFHRSLTEFLLVEKDNSDFHIDAATMHRRIARYFLDTHEGSWEDCSSDYALKYVAHHLLKAVNPKAADYKVILEDLAKLLGDFDFAYTKICRGGLNGLLEDLHEGEKKLAPNNAAPLTELISVLEPEARGLLWWRQNPDSVARQPNFPAQQLYNRALQLQAALAAKAKSKLDKFTQPYLAFGWRAGAKPASTPLLQLLRLPFFPGRRESRPTALTIAHDRRYAAFGYGNGSIEVCDLRSGQSVKRLHMLDQSVVMVDANTAYGLVCATSNGIFTFWDPETWKATRTVALSANGKFAAARITGDGTKALMVAENNEVSWWDLETSQRLQLFTNDVPLRDLAMRDDGRYALAGERAGAPMLWDLEDNAPARRLEMPQLSPEQRSGFWGLLRDLAAKWVGRTAVALSQYNNFAASAHIQSDLNSLVILWDLQSGKSFRQIVCPKLIINALRMSEDGRRTIIAGATSTMTGATQIFDSESGNTLGVAGIDAPAERLAISTDGRELVIVDTAGGLYCLHFTDG